MTKYMIDIEALKDCLSLLPVTMTMDGKAHVYLEDVLTMIDKFPKDKCGTEYRDMLNKLVTLKEDNKTNYDILTGKGLSKI